ncbi:ATP-binding protein [Prevotella communis]|uniref:AAA family ATPase n=1 Tax=Prevotella communis TaxID=2913614 RepID=UPI001EDAF716|nr:AAA family ATPase [Prevotella communis]UKK62320.1 ATP-binding protein [Prevotella communis]UKK65147.1 ATP-binding protein [Prevotella communis]
MRKLIIKNFGPVINSELELKAVNLLIGEQSIGKSTIAKLITIMTDIFSLNMVIRYGHKGWSDQLKSYGLDIYSKDDYHIQYEWFEKEIHLILTITNKEASISLTKGKTSIKDTDKITKTLAGLKPIFHQEQFLSQLKDLVDNAKGAKPKDLISSLQQLVFNSIYIPAERNFFSFFSKALPALNLVRESIPQNLLRFSLEYQNAKSAYNNYDSPLLNVSYEYDGSDDYFTDHSSNQRNRLSYASSGIQSTIPLLLVLQYAVNKREYSSFVIEEPETNLFPDKQVSLLRHILKTVNSDGRTLTITTHSPYLLSALNNSLFAGLLIKKYGEGIDKELAEIIDKDCCLTQDECSVYSLGESVNGKDFYCKSVVDPETGMIDSNALDGVSLLLSAEFSKLEDLLLSHNQ